MKNGNRKDNMRRLDDEELAETTGGIAWWIPLGIGVVAGVILKDWSDFKDGVKDGWKAYN
jgi:hypothetical protein